MRINPGVAYNKFKKTLSTDKEEGIKGKALGLKEGDTIKGEIIDANQNGVKVKLSNGQVVSAKINGDFTFSIGEEVTFVVKDSTVEQLLLTPDASEGSQIESKVLSILINANLPDTKENKEMVLAFIENQMPVDKESLNAFVRTMKQNPSSSMKTLVFMVKHNLPVTAENIQQLNHLTDKEHVLSKNIASLSEDISTTIRTQLQSDGSERVQGKLVLSDNLELSSKMDQMISKDNAFIDEKFQTVTKDQEQISFIKHLNGVSKMLENVEQQVVIKGATEGSEEKITSKVIGEALDHIMVKNSNDKLSLPIKGHINNVDYEQLAKTIYESTGHTINDKTSINDLILLAKDTSIDLTQLRSFLEMIEDQATYHAVAKGLLMSEEQLEDVDKMKAYFKELHVKVSTLIENSNLDGQTKSGEMIKNEATNVKSSVEFMNALNQDFSMLHLPLYLGDQVLNSELYVMNDNAKKKKDTDTITALIRLDLLNLGHMDIYVKKTAKNVTVNFYMEDKTQISYMEERVYQLHKALNGKGYNAMGISVELLQEAFDLTKSVFADEGETSEVKRYSFDMRA